MHKLVICDDEGKTTIVPMIRDEITIGRKAGNTIRLTERNVSRHHARLLRKDDTYTIEDLGSLLGTKVAGKHLHSEIVSVVPNDQFMIGDYSLSIRTDVSADVPLGRQIASGDEAGIGKVTPHARLVVIKGPELGREIDLTADLYVIGRSEEANCRINDPSMSRAHARIDLEGNHWTISDLDSVNGILINGFRKDDYVLKAGDVIELGGVRLRFVAPGEPYEYRPPQPQVPAVPQATSASDSPVTPEGRSHALLWGLGFVAFVAALGIVLTVVLGGKELDPAKGNEGVASTADADEQSYEALMESGKDQLQTQSWAEAAKLFALALEKQPADAKAQELKQLALLESDAKAAFDKAAAATKQSVWGDAYNALASIPRSSRYYDEAWLGQAVREYCRALTEGAREALRFGKLLKAEENLSILASLPKLPAECDTTRQQLHGELATKLREVAEAGTEAVDAGVVPEAKTGTDRPRSVGVPDKPVRDLKKPASATGPKPNDPMLEAREALDRGDRATAIAILEQRGGSERNALALLATLYMQSGNRAGYEAVANRFIQLFPSDPKTPQFKRNLGQ